VKLDKIKLLLEYGNLEFTDCCVDCGALKTVKIYYREATEEIPETHIMIENGALFEPPTEYNYGVPMVLKCDSCYKLDPLVHQRNEIYSRCVGYLRPVLGWNNGKKAEFKQRAMFDLGSELPKEERPCSSENII
jgi:hypothetical protein